MPTAEELAQSQSQSQSPSTAESPAGTPDIGNIVNAAVTAHLKRSLGKAVSEALEAALKPVMEKVEAVAQKPAAETPKADPKATPEFTAMQRQLEEMKSKFEAEAGARAAAEKRQREDRAFSDLRNTLQSAGVKPEMVDVAAKVLFHADSRVSFDENGNALFRHTKTVPGYGEEDEILPLAAGVQAYVKSPAAAPFLPSPAASKAAPLPARRPSGGATSGALELPNDNASFEEKLSSSMAREQQLRAQFGDI